MPNAMTFPHTAITTWDGFIYQGKVALYHTLKILNEDLKRDYQLQLDSLEDFAILEGDENISFHQVKAKKSEYFSSYDEDFKKLNDKSENCEKLFFHLAKDIKDKTDTEILALYPKVKIYKYDKQRFCPVNDIDKKIENLCHEIYKAHFEEFKQTSTYCSETRIQLEQVIIDKVITIHRLNHDDVGSDRKLAYTETIEFSRFRQILCKDLNEEQHTPEYFFYKIITDFNRYYNEFCNDYERELDEKSLANISDYMGEIILFNHNQMIRFIKNIMPHRQFQFEKLSDYHDFTPQKDEVKDAFFYILHSLEKGDLNDSLSCINWIVENKDSYTPTMIDSRKSKKALICSNIIENAKENDLDVLFERNSLITFEIDSDSIVDDAKSINSHIKGSDPSDQQQFSDEVRITAYSGVKLISLDRARERINK